MDTELKSKGKNALSRLFAAVIALVVQVAVIVIILNTIGKTFPGIELIFNVIGFIFALYLVGSAKHLNSSSRMSWLVLIALVPMFGIIFYLLKVKSHTLKALKKRYEDVDDILKPMLTGQKTEVSEIAGINPSGAGIASYLDTHGAFPASEGNSVKYFAEAVDGLKSQLEDLRNAKEFIFMEYFIVEDAPFFRELIDILAQKVKEGVEVRFMYDDLGSSKAISREFTREINRRGIKCKIFNPVNFFLSLFINNRDHRKITVIDGKIGYTGGYNLAEEYFNYVEKCGFWKDTGIRIEGPAVNTLTTLFLEGWNYNYKKNIEPDIARFVRPVSPSPSAVPGSYVQPFGDSPFSSERFGENVYMSLAGRSNKFLYITTPYLIITDEMVNALSLAARRGVDVRLVTPGISSQKIVHSITRSFYRILIRNGVRIYEFTPGFVHAKMFLSDNEVGAVGTVNMDFRSLYLHFEDCTVMYNTPCLKDMYKDFRHIFEVSKEIRHLDLSLGTRIKMCLLRIVAPLL